ncbi:MAG: NAD(P)H-hydrate dehydratase [Deltaproteobacteria bacterium]|nr:NAD(P)H-hydrate dehydratase [Deltaproteobacteria bacterium]MBW2044609.1 NAD(P)H-hydrate dehydratase [Deltaproteobacteria bacterium]MBW2300664.1 NAD(P)H-hydrate dehydratase [Deltaproteobacteria bacterium]
MRLVKASEIQEMDRVTIQELGIPGAVLMENAGRGATKLFLDHFKPLVGSHVLFLCGRGNNGGDGYVIARYLNELGFKTTVIVLSKFEKLSGDALTNFEVLTRMGLDILEVPDSAAWAEHRRLISGCDYIVDGIFGTGLNAPVKGFYEQVIQDANSAKKPIMSIDIPSGLNADTGQVMGVAIKAELTVTFGFPKLGEFVFPGAHFVGRLMRVDIGIPSKVADTVPGKISIVEPSEFSSLFNVEKPDVHKGRRGHLLVLAGSTGKTGAATMTALGALRAGAGLVTVGIPGSLNPILENKLTEAMTFPLPETGDGTLSMDAEKHIYQLMEGKTALAIGPGLSTREETKALVRRIIAQCPLPVIIDADGLNALPGELEALGHKETRAILTPHPGEMARLISSTPAEVQKNRVEIAAEFAQAHACILVLKGARTVIAEPGGEVHLNPTGNPALASGGSGDVLTGLIAGFVARGWPLSKAAIAGVYVHGLAADALAEDMGQSGVLASELLDTVPLLTACLAQGEWPLEAPPPHADFYNSL